MQEGDTELGGLQIPHGNNVNPPTPTPGPQPVAPAAPQNPQSIPPAQPTTQPTAQTFRPNSTTNGETQLNNLTFQQQPHASSNSRQAPYRGMAFRSPTVTQQSISSNIEDIVLEKEKKKPHLGIIILIVAIVFVIGAGTFTAIYFSNNKTTTQPQSLSVDNYGELLDGLGENEVHLSSFYEIIEDGLNGEIDSYMFLINNYIDSNDKLTNSINKAESAVPKMEEYLNDLTQAKVKDDVKNITYKILDNYNSYSIAIMSLAQKIQNFRIAFLDSDQNELNGIMISYDFSSSTTDVINTYEHYYQELRSKAEECMNNSAHSVQECIKSADSYWTYRRTMESDHQTVSELLIRIIDNNQLEIIKNTNNDILSLRKLLEAEFWALKSE